MVHIPGLVGEFIKEQSLTLGAAEIFGCEDVLSMYFTDVPSTILPVRTFFEFSFPL